MRSSISRRSVFSRSLAALGTALLLLVAMPVQAQDGEDAAEGTTEKVAILKTNMGDIVLRFFPDVAPNHVENFLTLAADGVYDGVKFHRVIPGFMIQSGDPNTKDDDRGNDGMGGAGEGVKGEFSRLPHKRGVLSMARSSSPDSARSQFFICVANPSFLDGKYSAFGMVVEGMDVADKIVNLPRDETGSMGPKDNPLPGNPAIIEKVVIEERSLPARPDWAKS
jgi:peptidyl-prolyl cis-trans isomerase B (cyclophilin B)